MPPPFYCPFCLCIFENATFLQAHVFNNHPDNVPEALVPRYKAVLWPEKQRKIDAHQLLALIPQDRLNQYVTGHVDKVEHGQIPVTISLEEAKNHSGAPFFKFCTDANCSQYNFRFCGHSDATKRHSSCDSKMMVCLFDAVRCFEQAPAVPANTTSQGTSLRGGRGRGRGRGRPPLHPAQTPGLPIVNKFDWGAQRLGSTRVGWSPEQTAYTTRTTCTTPYMFPIFKEELSMQGVPGGTSMPTASGQELPPQPQRSSSRKRCAGAHASASVSGGGGNQEDSEGGGECDGPRPHTASAQRRRLGDACTGGVDGYSDLSQGETLHFNLLYSHLALNFRARITCCFVL